MRWRWRLMAAVAVLGLAGAGCTDGETPTPATTTATAAPSAEGDPAWRTLAAVPSERTEVAAAAVGDRIWVLGGYGPDGATMATAEVYDTGADSWARGPDLPVAGSSTAKVPAPPASRQSPPTNSRGVTASTTACSDAAMLMGAASSGVPGRTPLA